jgi:hypothetical protein
MNLYRAVKLQIYAVEVSVQLYVPVALTPVQYLQNRTLVWDINRCEHFTNEQISVLQATEHDSLVSSP